MSTNNVMPQAIKKENARALEDIKINLKVKLSAFWIALMLFYIYADILGFYTPGVIENVVLGKIGGIQITEGFLLVMAVWMAVPSVMVFLSLVLKPRANRVLNIATGVVSILMLAATFVAGEISARYTFQALIEAALMISIIWHAWKWPKKASAV
jgi:hypothetical protein